MSTLPWAGLEGCGNRALARVAAHLGWVPPCSKAAEGVGCHRLTGDAQGCVGRAVWGEKGHASGKDHCPGPRPGRSGLFRTC